MQKSDRVATSLLTFVLAAGAIVTPLPAVGATVVNSQTAEAVVACDAVAAHPDDPDKVSPGRVKAQIDLPLAIETCRRAAAAEPDNPRIRYQLARMLFYTGERAESLILMKSAADAGYRQAQFVYGVFINYQREGAPKDLCLAEAYWHKAAVAERQAARINYVRERLKGRFAGCSDMASVSDMKIMLEAAQKDSGNYYETLFIKDLAERLVAFSPEQVAGSVPATKQGTEPAW